MAKDQGWISKHFKDMFQRKRKDGEDAEEKPLEESQPVEGDVQPQIEQPVEEQYPDRIEIKEGALLELWHRWKGGEEPPVLTLKTEGQELPFDQKREGQECQRLAELLEKDAKKRLIVLKDAEKEEGQVVGPTCKVYLSTDRLAAWLFLFPPSDPEASLPMELIGQTMQAHGVTTGINSTAVLHLFQKKPYFCLVPVAVGTPAVPGVDGKIIEHYPRTLEKKSEGNEEGVVDYRSVNYVQMINKGDVICDIIPPQEGQAGVCVDGKVLEPGPVHMDKIPSGRNTTLSEDGLQLVAALDGHLQYSSNAFHVRPVLEVQGDVDYSTGNIDFKGDVHIAGNVRENFSVRASGTITIDGLVEGATIVAGGDLVIASGVLGNYKAVLKSWGWIRTKYLENCVAYAKIGVLADCIMASQIFSDDTIQVMSGRGTIIGSSLMAAHTINTRIIGSRAGTKTTIKLGVLPFAKEELNDNQAEVEAVRKEMGEVDTELKDLVVRQGLAVSNNELSKAQLRKSVLAMKEMQLLKHREKLVIDTPDLSKCRMEADVVYPVTQIIIGTDCLNLDLVTNRCKLRYNQETQEIEMI